MSAATERMPADVFLIGCGEEAAVAGEPSAESMGFKAWSLLRMARLPLPVPPAFVLGTRHCRDEGARRRATSRATWGAGLQALERATGATFGDSRRPLLLSVRSGAAVSMPGMLETLLDVGLCDATVGGFLRQTGNPRLVWDAYRRLVVMFGAVVARLPKRLFDDAAHSLFGSRDVSDLDFAELRTLTRTCLSVYADAAGHAFPQDPAEQLAQAIGAVLASWQAPKAVEYRRIHRIGDDAGTAVTVQAMVFGNAGGRSGAGVGFTRDPSSGDPGLWVDFLFDAQGEDVVAGRRRAYGHDELAAVLPKVWASLEEAATGLEQAFGDMQDFEFTVQEGRLFFLQTRAGKRTPAAAARIALDLFEANVIDRATARERSAGLDRKALGRPCIASSNGAAAAPLARAPSASPGVVVGEIAVDPARAIARHAAGHAVILVRRDAETDDIAALEAAAGLLTQRGARTSHAAVVARQLGVVCLVGCAALTVDDAARQLRIGDRAFAEGDLITLDGNDGAVYAGRRELEIRYPEELLARLASLRA